MAHLTPFATVVELEAFWKDLSPAEESRAGVLLVLASNRLRLIATDVGTDLDAEVLASEAYKTTLQWVIMESVKRAMQSPVDMPAVESYQQTAGPYSENIKYTNPTGDLWFKKAELSGLGLSGKQSLSSLSTSQTDIYTESS